MAQDLLSDSIITKDSLVVLHDKLNFIPNITLEYDDQYANAGAKVGNTINIRDANQFTTRTGKTYTKQDVLERSTPLVVEDQIGVDFEFPSSDLTLTVDRFRERYLDPAMSSLAAKMESIALGMTTDIYNVVDGVGSTLSTTHVARARQQLVDSLAPKGKWCMLHDTEGNIDLTDATKGLFNSQSEIAKQYQEGAMGHQGGFMHYENTHLNKFTSGTAVEGATGYLINNGSGESATDAEIKANQQTITVDTGSTTFVVGDVITIAGVNRVHPETKVDTGDLQKFVVKTASGANATSLVISPPIIASGGRQNVTAAAADDAAISKVAGGAGFTARQSIAFQKGAFAFATVDLEKPRGVDMCARHELDGISMRFIRDYDVDDDVWKSRFDIMYGKATLREQLASKVLYGS